MATGLKIFNTNGTLQLDMSSRTFRLLAVAVVNGSGSLTVTGFSGNIQAAVDTASNGSPAVTVNQSTGEVSWTYSGTERGVVRVLEF